MCNRSEQHSPLPKTNFLLINDRYISGGCFTGKNQIILLRNSTSITLIINFF